MKGTGRMRGPKGLRGLTAASRREGVAGQRAETASEPPPSPPQSCGASGGHRHPLLQWQLKSQSQPPPEIYFLLNVPGRTRLLSLALMKNTTRKIGCGRQGAVGLSRHRGRAGAFQEGRASGRTGAEPPEGRAVRSGLVWGQPCAHTLPPTQIPAGDGRRVPGTGSAPG